MNPQTIPFRNRYLAVYSNDRIGATPVVFLHGNSSSAHTWEKQFNSFLNDKYHLIAFDFLGFGDSARSDNPGDDYSIVGLKESLLAIIDHFQLEQYYLVGHSLGGHVIAQSLDALPGCLGVMSIGAPPITLPPDIPSIYLPTAPVGVMFVRDCTDEALQGVAANFYYEPARIPETFTSDFRRSDPVTREAIGAILGSASFRDEQLMYTHSPVRKAFVCGEHERSINNAYYETLDFPNTWQRKIYQIPDAAHVPHWENADAVNRLIDQFAEGQ